MQVPFLKCCVHVLQVTVDENKVPASLLAIPVGNKMNFVAVPALPCPCMSKEEQMYNSGKCVPQTRLPLFQQCEQPILFKIVGVLTTLPCFKLAESHLPSKNVSSRRLLKFFFVFKLGLPCNAFAPIRGLLSHRSRIAPSRGLKFERAWVSASFLSSSSQKKNIS